MATLALALGSLAGVRADQTLFDEGFVNGWQNWSWAATNAADTTYAHGGSVSVAVTSSPWSAFYLHHDAINTAPYDALSFWVHGGPAGGQKVMVKALLSDVSQPEYVITVPGGTWTKFVIPLASLGAANKADLNGIWFQEGAGVSAATYYVDDIKLTSSVPVIPPPPVDGSSVYEDSLNNGWQNWSWATVDAGAADPVHTGTAAVQVALSPWSALYLRHAAMDTSTYGSVTFWVNGGATGGQKIRLAALRESGEVGSFSLEPLTALTWRKVTVALKDLNVADVSDLVGFWLQESAGQSGAAYFVDDFVLDAKPPPAIVNVAVQANSIVRKVDPKLFGMNAAIWDPAFKTATTAQLLSEADVQVLRFPGGSISDEYHWKTNKSNGYDWTWVTGFDDFASIAKTVQSEVFITVNYGSGTPEEAAEWVTYSNKVKKYGFKYWEVGNENFGTWETDWNTRPHDPRTYAERFKVYFDQMKAADPTIKIGAVAVVGEDDAVNYTDLVVTNPRTGQKHSGWTAVMLTRMRELNVTPDFLALHRYEQNPGNEDDAFLLQSSKGWATDAAVTRQVLTDYLGVKGAKVELAATENNSVSFNPGKQTTSLVNGLYLADSIGNILQTEYNSLVWWSLRGSYERSNNNNRTLYGWRNYGDYGIVVPTESLAPADRYPTFYVLKALRSFARGGERVVKTVSDYQGLSVYAVSEGPRVRLLVINKNRFHALNAKVTIGGRVLGKNATVYTYGIAQDEAARTGEGSADVQKKQLTDFGSAFVYEAAPYSVNVIVLTTKPAGGAEPGFPE
ncbi:alpha-L-arabinofuranosidase [Nibricoccus sp. IMCC34717]|uniref:alpha-L-arabinofuranosidase n=1 Tax=Nibricoccus sp. IMCC34717 TaxID=3034021 RepID=UPI00384BC140